MCLENNIKHNILKRAKELILISDFYSRIYKNIDLTDFNQIPLITKKDLLLDQELYPPFGSNVIVDRDKINRLHRTSGTSNRPLMLVLTKNDVSTISKTGAKAFKVAGIKPGDIVFNCMNYCMWMGGAMDHLSIEETGATVVPYSVGNTENLVQLMMDLKGTCIHATPSYLSVIERVALEKFHVTAKELNLKKGFFGGESGMQDKVLRSNIEQNWGMMALDANYGMSEAMSIIGAECFCKNGLHFTAEEVLYPELRIEEKNNVSHDYIKQGAIGELVVTNLVKEAQPLLRYATGDIIEIISTQQCDCGESSFRFKVVGRRDDMLVIKGINFYPESVRDIITQYLECTGNYRVIVPTSDLIDKVKLLIEIKSNNMNLDNLKSNIIKRIRSKYFVSCEVEFTETLKSNDNKQKLVERINIMEW